MHRSVVFSIVAASYLTGVLVTSFVPLGYMLAAAIGAAGVCCALLAFRSPAATIRGILFVAALTGGMFHMDHTRTKVPEIVSIASESSGQVTIRGYASDEERVYPTYGTIPFKVTSVKTLDGWQGTWGTILVYLRQGATLAIGDAAELSGTLKAPSGEQSYLLARSIDGVLSQTTLGPEPEGMKRSARVRFNLEFKKALVHQRMTFEDVLRRTLVAPVDSYAGGILLGSDSAMPREIKNAFRITGTTHVMAVSGYNIAIVAAALMAFCTRLVRRQYAFWLAIAGIATFTLLVGAPSSAVRALIMATVVLAAQSIGRRYDPLNGLLAAAVVMVALNLFIMRYDVGFQLSFVAVAGLAYIGPLLADAKRSGMLEQTLNATLSAQLAVLPIILFTFGTVSVYALPANLVIIPLIPVSMALAGIAGVTGLVWLPLGKTIGLFAAVVLRFQLAMVQLLAGLPGASLTYFLPGWGVFAIYSIAVCALFWFYRKNLLRLHAGREMTDIR